MSFNYFRSTTDNLLTLQTLGFLSGLSQNWSNSGKLKNEGFDISFNAKLVATKDWQWQLGASAGHYKNASVSFTVPAGSKSVSIYSYHKIVAGAQTWLAETFDDNEAVGNR